MTTQTKTRSNHAGPRAALIGRAEETARLDHLLRNARAGRSGVLVIHGERGIGKSALLDYAVRQAAGFRLIRVRGAQAEAALPYAGLHRLCGLLPDVLARVPPPQRTAVETAVTLQVNPDLDRILVCLGTLALLTHAAESQPLICVIDDAQWMDEVTAQVLALWPGGWRPSRL